MRTLVQNMQVNMASLLPEYLLLTWSSIFECLKGSCGISSTLLEEFDAAGGNNLLAETLTWLENNNAHEKIMVFSHLKTLH